MGRSYFSRSLHPVSANSATDHRRLNRIRWLRSVSHLCGLGHRRKLWPLAALVLAPSPFIMQQPASAQACGAPVGGSVTCTNAGNPYASGIAYNPAGVAGLFTITLQPDVNVMANPGVRGVDAGNSAGVAVTSAGTIATQGVSAYGVFAGSDNGATINNSATISTNGFNARGIDAEATGGTVTIDNTGTINTQGDQAAGIWVPGLGLGTGPANTTVTNSADITTNGGTAASAIRITLNEPLNTGSATINLQSGTLTTNGVITSAAVIVGTNGPGSATLNMNGGTIVNNSTHMDSHGLTAQAQGNGSATVNFNAGTITTQGGIGAVAWNAGLGLGNITLISAAGTVVNAQGTTTNSNGLAALGGSAANGTSVLLDSQSVITATNMGIDAQSQLSAPVTVKQTGGSITAGNIGIHVTTDGAATVTNTAPIQVSNVESRGMQVLSNGGPTTIDHSTSIAAPGEFAIGIEALGSTANVTLQAGATVAGGWQADSGAVGPSGLPAAGVAIGSTGGGATLTNNGKISALSDLAVAELDRFGIGAAGPLTIVNNGNITGFVTLGDGDSTFRNLTPNSFDIRHFADINGDGVPDIKRVAISNFGGGNDTFLNEANGVVRLAPVAGATPDPAQYFVPTTGIDSRPLEGTFYDFNREGLLQGQMTFLETFDNAGIIDLRGSVTGNTLVITGGPGVDINLLPGNGVFIANGGQLLLNTVLNAGIPLGGQTNSYSDMLIVDSTQLGAGGPTAIGITLDPTSAGALTPGNGIEVVEVRNKDASAPGIFVLGSRAASGAFEYTLYHNGVGGDAADGNWYLRSALIPPPVPPGPVPPGPVPPPIPDYRNEVPVDIVLPALANRLGLGTLGTYHDRIGDDYPAPVQPAEPIICKAPSKDGGCAVPAAVAAEMQPTRAAWGRLFGETGSVDFDATNPAGAVQNIVEHGPSYDFDMYGLQAGMDLLRRLNDDGSRDIAGFYIGVGRITADVDAVLGGPAGTSSVNGYSLGGYWTRIAEKGWYVDAVLQATWYDAEGNAEGRGRFAGESFDTDGWGFAASLEGGYPFDLGNGWSVEPQAQLVYQHVSLDDGSDAFARIDYDATDALYGRLGGRLTKDWLTQSGKRMTAWGKADVWSGFGASATTTFSGPAGGNPISFDTDIGGTWGSVGLGLQGEVKKNVTMFASGDYNFGLGGDGDFDSWSGRIGMKVKW